MSEIPAKKTYRFGVNLLGLVAAGLMIAAMFYPWWSFTIMETKKSNIYPYLVDGPASEIIGYKRSPQMTLLTGVLIATIALTLLGSLLTRKVGRILLIVAGALSLVGTWRLLARVTGVAARFDIPIQGEGIAVYEGFAQIDVSTQLELGTYLVIGGAILAILACLLQRWARVGK
jgi:hypothetical protein